jgi:hypothetical protein
MGDSSRSIESICGPCEYITPMWVRAPSNTLSVEIVYETRSAETINLLGALPMKLNG